MQGVPLVRPAQRLLVRDLLGTLADVLSLDL